MSSAAPTILTTAVSRDLMSLDHPHTPGSLLYIVAVVAMLGSRIIISKQMLNRSPDRPSPCLNPFVIMKGSDFSPSTLTSDFVSAKVSLLILTRYT